MPSGLCTGGEQREAEAHPLSVADTDARCQATSIAKSISASPHRIGQGVAVQQAGYHRRSSAGAGQRVRRGSNARHPPCASAHVAWSMMRPRLPTPLLLVEDGSMVTSEEGRDTGCPATGRTSRPHAQRREAEEECR